MGRRHWSERLSCSCGKIFRNYQQEAFHRHNHAYPVCTHDHNI